MPFTKDNPAEDVAVLGDWLIKKHSEDICYRGQPKDYGAMLPSSCRGLNLGSHGGFRLISADGTIEGTAPQRLQQALMNDQIARFGVELGSYIAQQYFCFSRSIDFSRSPSVAIFFATFEAPKFVRAIRQSNDLGVIYRLHHTKMGGRAIKQAETAWRTAHLLDDTTASSEGCFSGESGRPPR
jgi:hypothetical protein